MNKKYFLIIVIISLLIVSTGAVVAGSAVLDPELVKSKFADVQIRIQALLHMPLSQQQSIVKEKQQAHEIRTKGTTTPSAVTNTNSSSFVGILDGGSVPAPFASSEFKVLNFWGGQFNGKSIGVFAGYRPADPLRGVVVVFDDENTSTGKFYDAPNVAGPVRITAEDNGVLTLNAISGTFEIYNDEVYPPQNVSTPGGVTYQFNLTTRNFTIISQVTNN